MARLIMNLKNTLKKYPWIIVMHMGLLRAKIPKTSVHTQLMQIDPG